MNTVFLLAAAILHFLSPVPLDQGGIKVLSFAPRTTFSGDLTVEKASGEKICYLDTHNNAHLIEGHTWKECATVVMQAVGSERP